MKISTVTKTQSSKSQQVEFQKWKDQSDSGQIKFQKKTYYPKWKLKFEQDFDDLLIHTFLDKQSYLSDDENNKNKMKYAQESHIIMQSGHQKKSQPQKQSHKQNTDNQNQQQQTTSKNTHSSQNSNIKNLKPTPEQLNLVENDPNAFFDDALQLEAFQYWLTEIGCPNSPIFSLSPIVSYYLYSILIFDLQLAQHFMIKDNQYRKFRKQLLNRGKLLEDIKKQSYFKSKDYRDQKLDIFLNECAFLSLIPQGINPKDIDIDIILNDITQYSQQYMDFIKVKETEENKNIIEEIQKQRIEQLLVHSQNNLVLGFIVFNFTNQSAQNKQKYRYPISQFDEIQCTDYLEIIKNFNKDEIINDYKPLSEFIFNEHLHSEKALALWIINDSMKSCTIFKQLELSIQSKNLSQEDMILKSIQLDITSKNKMCEVCVNMFKLFPLKYYLDQILTHFRFRIQDEIYLIINSQFLQDPRYKVGEPIKADPILTEIVNNNLEEIDENQEFQQVAEVQDQQLLELFAEQDINAIQNQNQEQQTQQNSQQQDIQTNQTQFIQQQDIVQQNALKIKYFVLQTEQEVTGLMSQQMFELRYRNINGTQNMQNKTKIFEIPLLNTFFASCCNEEEVKSLSSSISQSENKESSKSQIEIQQSNQGEVIQTSSKQSLSKSGINRLLNKLFNIEEFFNIKQKQQEKIILEQQSQSKRLSKSIEKLSNDFKTTFLTSLAIFYSKNLKKRNLRQFQIYQVFQLLQYTVIQNFSTDIYLQEFKDSIVGSGIIFNEYLNKDLLLKDYLFFKSKVKFEIKTIFESYKNPTHNEFVIKLFQFCKEQNSWQEQKIMVQHDKIIKNCRELLEILKQFLQRVNDQQNEAFYLSVCTLYEISVGCQKQIIQLLNQDIKINKQLIKIQFCSMNLIVDNYQLTPIQQSAKDQTQLDNIQITYENYNLFDFQIFINRYKQKEDIEEISFNDIIEVIEEFSCFDCQDHDQLVFRNQ